MAIKVTLLTHTPNPEQTVAMAAKLCYSPSGIEDIREGLDEEKTSSFIDMLASLGHASPTEHAYFTFGIEGISRACSHQLVRHRIASYSQQSQRYVDGTRFDFVTPPEIAKNKRLLPPMKRLSRLRLTLTRKSEMRLLSVTSTRNVPISTAERMKKLSMPTRLTTKNPAMLSSRKPMRTQDLFFRMHRQQKLSALSMQEACRTFLHTVARNRAQWEIREVAEQMLLQCLEVAPHLFKNCGPSCLFGPCPEGNMCCGKQKEMRQKYGREK